MTSLKICIGVLYIPCFYLSHLSEDGKLYNVLVCGHHPLEVFLTVWFKAYINTYWYQQKCERKQSNWSNRLELKLFCYVVNIGRTRTVMVPGSEYTQRHSIIFSMIMSDNVNVMSYKESKVKLSLDLSKIRQPCKRSPLIIVVAWPKYRS